VPEFPPLRIYLDSNVLFSASHDPASPFLNFWRMRDVSVVTSYYAVGEVSRNIDLDDHRGRFENLLARTQLVSDTDVSFIPSHLSLASKDAPILAAAIFASVDYLATGDKRHFAHLYGTAVLGVRIVRPSDFLELNKARLPE
jgi:predicted nucleic acid-binding protein